MNTFVFLGAKQTDVCKAVTEDIASLLTAYDRDANPADHRLGTKGEVPWKVWPGASIKASPRTALPD